MTFQGKKSHYWEIFLNIRNTLTISAKYYVDLSNNFFLLKNIIEI